MKLPLSQTKGCCSFNLLILSPISWQWEASERLCGAYLPTGVKPSGPLLVANVEFKRFEIRTDFIGVCETKFIATAATRSTGLAMGRACLDAC